MLSRWRQSKNFREKFRFFPSKLQSLVAIHSFSSPIEFTTKEKPENSFSSKFALSQRVLGVHKTVILTPQVVQSTLRSCSSDLIALSFFLWCAKLPNYFHDRNTFLHMVSVISNLTTRFRTVRGILEELENIGCIVKAQTFLLLLRIYWCGGRAMYELVIDAFEEMCKYGYTPNSYTRNIFMDVLFKIGHVNVALQVLKETQVPNFLSFSIAICNLCKLNDLNNVKSVLRSMLSKGYYLNSKTFSLVLNCFCKFTRLAEALQLLGLMVVLGAPVSVNVWSILIDGFCKSGRIDIAAYLLEKMLESGCSPNIVTCTPIIKGFLESQMYIKAFEILNALELEGCYPDLVLSNVLIDCLSKMGMYDDAFEVFSSLRERQLIPDVYTFASLMSTVCLSRQYVLLPLLISGLAIEPDLVVCNSLLSYFCKAGYPEGAVDFYNNIIDSGFTPDKYSFAGLLSALCSLGRIQEAVNVYCEIVRTHPYIDAHIHTIIVNGLIKLGNPFKATRLFKKVAAEFPLDVVSYNVTIGGLIRSSQRGEAYDLFSQMKQMDIPPNKHTYNLILSGLCKDGDVKMIKSIIQEMIDRNIGLDNAACSLMKYLGYKSHNLPGLLQRKADSLWNNGCDTGAYASNEDFGNVINVLDNSTSSWDDLQDAAVSVG
ncbi:putative pentatricopeptide repeat-containing protein At1g16830 [Olea europaea var. sylvestris]|uniref:putative pentatricopeptide repeat-containing protein At1g16830 n=1 Tax=Olea europaea var. sylvestris TaxID=158386 RepID=UPI000C1D8B4F|nr:putative pentatricopeptide repeat-containing protein At1g16830 [Olea europaea var. sylvestris]